MSDFSSLEQSFGLMPAGFAMLAEEAPPASSDVQAHEVNFRHLRGAADISRILHLRQEIQLPASALADAGFATREKKETTSASWARSSASGNS
jgi:hypothetical protein